MLFITTAQHAMHIWLKMELVLCTSTGAYDEHYHVLLRSNKLHTATTELSPLLAVQPLPLTICATVVLRWAFTDHAAQIALEPPGKDENRCIGQMKPLSFCCSAFYYELLLWSTPSPAKPKPSSSLGCHAYNTPA